MCSWLGGLQHLKHLWLSKNRLRSLPPAFRDLRALEQLLLSQNFLRRLPIEVLTVLLPMYLSTLKTE